MAKRIPMPSLQEMEREMGFSIDPLTLNLTGERFYSDLRLVIIEKLELCRREYEVFNVRKVQDRVKETNSIPPQPGKTLLAVDSKAPKVIYEQRYYSGSYRFNVDIDLGRGFTLPLLCNEIEAMQILTITKFEVTPKSSQIPSSEPMSSQIPSSRPGFFDLPQEVRDKIYNFALPERQWFIGKVHHFMFPTAVGDPSGFFFPFGQDQEVLRINKRIRQEAMPVAYRRTTFHLDDMDNVIKLLVAIGQAGRDNITSLRFSWESRSDLDCQWKEFPDADDNHLKLPVLHAERLIQLLERCKKLKHLTIHHAKEVLDHVPKPTFKTNAGIQGLCGLRGIETFEVLDATDKAFQQSVIEWLRQEVLGKTR